MDLMRQGQRGLTGLHTRLYHLTGGRVGGRLGKVETVLLTTTGRKSGALRTTPLTVIVDGQRLILIASNGGAAKHPDWYVNLVANPDVVVQRQGQILHLRARTAGPQEREALWRKAVEVNGGYAGYQRKTQREIPVVICEPAPAQT
jgi:deazaflavin-dependent oxidoreductase (nitroreductase family)